MKIKLKYDEVEDRWCGERLRFKQYADDNYMIINTDEQLLGYIELIRVGEWRHWCILLNQRCYLSPGCTDEVREMQRILGSHKTSEAKDE